MSIIKKGKFSKDVTLYNDINIEYEIDKNHAYKAQVEEFCKSVELGIQPMLDYKLGKKSVEIINAFYLAAMNCSSIKLPLKTSKGIEKLFDRS